VKEKPKNLWWEVKNVVLRKSDVRAIVTALGEGGTVTKIDGDEDEAEDVEDLLSSKKRFRTIWIYRSPKGTSDRVGVVVVDAERAYINFDAPDNADVGVATTIKEIFLARRSIRLPKTISLSWTLAISGFLSLAVVGYMAARPAHPVSFQPVIYIFVSGAVLAFAAKLATHLQGDFVRFRPEPDDRKRIDWGPKVWDLVKIVVGAVIGYLIRGR
jgi:hypothetical protein